MLERIHYWLSGITERQIMIIAAILIFLPVLKPGCSSSLEDATMRLAVMSAGERPGAGIVIAAIDARAFNTYGPWPGPASALTESAERLRRMNPGLVVVDDRSDRGRFDLVFALQNLRGDPKSVTGYSFYESISDLPSGYAETTGGKTPKDALLLALPSTPSDDYSLHSMAGIDLDAVSGPRRRSTGDGFSNSFADADGRVRGQPLAVRLGHRAYPSIVLAAAAAAKGFTPIIAEGPAGKPASIALGEDRIDVPPDTTMPIAFRGPAGTFPRMSIVDIVAGNVRAEDVSGRIVLIGFTDPDIAMMMETPFGPMPSVEVLANSLATILEFRRVDLLGGVAWSAAAMLLALAVFALGAVQLRLWARLAVTAAIIAAAWAAAVLLWRFAGILVPAMQFTIFAASLFAVSAAWRMFVIEIPRRFRMRTFMMRVSPEELERAIRKPDAIVARGVTRDIVAMAIDIRGFASLATRCGQEQLPPLMREYRTIVARILIDHGAFIESWAGDECRAAFGAIMPGRGYELTASSAAVEMSRTFAAMRDGLAKRYGIDRIRLGIGITSGRAAVGGMGPRGVADIGIAGEAMERAVTLRALNKTFRTSIIVDDAVKSGAESSFSFRPLDPIFAAGTERIVHTHELIGKTGIIMPHLERYLEAREFYLKGEFTEAAHLFSLILAEHPHDGPSLVLLRRAKALAEDPPKGEWKGVWGSQ